MSDTYGFVVVGFLLGLFSGILFYLIKDMVCGFIEIHKINQELKKIS